MLKIPTATYNGSATSGSQQSDTFHLSESFENHFALDQLATLPHRPSSKVNKLTVGDCQPPCPDTREFGRELTNDNILVSPRDLDIKMVPGAKMVSQNYKKLYSRNPANLTFRCRQASEGLLNLVLRLCNLQAS